MNPLKRPRGHYINRFTNYIIARERAESDHAEAGEPGDARKQVDVKLLKLNRKTYLKLVEQYTAFVDKIRVVGCATSRKRRQCMQSNWASLTAEERSRQRVTIPSNIATAKAIGTLCSN